MLEVFALLYGYGMYRAYCLVEASCKTFPVGKDAPISIMAALGVLAIIFWPVTMAIGVLQWLKLQR